MRTPLRTAWQRLIVLVCLILGGLLTMGAGGPVLQGGQPGDLPLYPEQISAYRSAAQLPPLSAPASLLGDSATGQVLAQHEASAPRLMASTTKIMTALLVLERTHPADVVVVSPAALIGGSTMNLAAGETLTVQDLLWGLLLNSGNDAALALAEHVAGSEAAFVALMNERAAQLGMLNTHFANPHGLDAPDHYTSAYDLWLATQAAMQYPVFHEMVATPAHTAAGHSLRSTNELLTLDPSANGVKTGTTDGAGQCLVASVDRRSHRVIGVVLGSADRYADAQALFAHFDAHWQWAAAPQPAGPAAWLRLPNGEPVRVATAIPPDLFLPLWQWPLLRVQPVLQTADLAQPAGVIRWYLGNQLLAEAPASFLAVGE